MGWFTQTALDGIAGGVIGGGATGIAVWWTLRSEHKRYAQQRADDEALRLAGTARKLRHQAVEGAPEYLTAAFDWTVDVGTFLGSISDQHPVAAELLEACVTKIGTAGAGTGGMNEDGTYSVHLADVQGLVGALASADKLLTRLVRTPEYFKMTDEAQAHLKRAISSGAFL